MDSVLTYLLPRHDSFSALPDSLQLDSQPEVPVAGQPAHLYCSATHVYPPDAFTLSWFQGDKKVERQVEEELEDSDLFMFHSELEIPMAAEQTTYRCEAQLQIGQHLFRHNRTVTIQARGKSSTQMAHLPCAPTQSDRWAMNVQRTTGSTLVP